MPVQSDNDYFLIVYLDLVIFLKATFTKSALFPAHMLDAIIIVITY